MGLLLIGAIVTMMLMVVWGSSRLVLLVFALVDKLAELGRRK